MTPASDIRPPALPDVRRVALALMESQRIVAVEVGGVLASRADVRSSDEVAALVLRTLRERSA